MDTILDKVLFATALLLLGLFLYGPAISALSNAARFPDSVWKSIGRKKATSLYLIALSGGVYYWLTLRPLLRLGDMSEMPAKHQRHKRDMWSTDNW